MIFFLVQLKMCAGVCVLQMVRALVQPHLSDDLLLRSNNLCRQSEGECSTCMCLYVLKLLFYALYNSYMNIH